MARPAKGIVMKKHVATALFVLGGALALPVAGAEVALSGFATAGYAQSDQDYTYQRFVRKQGGFKRDSVVGVQMDAKLDNEFGFTLQGKLAPAIDSDNDINATVSWAFLSWRPSNDWLVRVGRMRYPMYLLNENMDVGATFDFARMPAEVYTTSQTTDGDGVCIDKTWNVDDSEITLQGYWATAKTSYRFFRRDDAPPVLSAGAYFVPVKLSVTGVALTLRQDDNTYRAGLVDTYTKITDDQVMPVTFPYVAMFPGVGYYQTSNQLPGPGVKSENDIHVLVYALGADVSLGNGFRVMGEYVRRDVRNIDSGPDSQGAYLAVLKSLGAWTPYLSVARLEPSAKTRDLYNKTNNNKVPGYIPGSALLNAAQRAGADAVMAYDQTTWAVGTSYRLNPTSRIKAEWARTRTGEMSMFIDAPPGGETGKQVVNIFSLSYNVVF
jgi:hypothetical protein